MSTRCWPTAPSARACYQPKPCKRPETSSVSSASARFSHFCLIDAAHLGFARILIAKPVSTFAEYARTTPLVEHGRAVAACGGLAQHRDMHDHPATKLRDRSQAEMPCHR